MQQAGQREAKIGLVALPPELELNEWLTDQMGQPSACRLSPSPPGANRFQCPYRTAKKMISADINIATL